MWWQTDFYSDSQTEKPLPLNDEDRKQGIRTKFTVATQFPKILNIGLMVSNFYPKKYKDFEVSKVTWLLEYYNMNGTPPFNDSKRDLPRVKLFDRIEGLLDEVNDIIGSAEYQAADFIDAVIGNLCTDKNFKEIDNMLSLENVYGIENSLEVKRSILAWLMGIRYDSIDGAVKLINENQSQGKDLTEALRTVGCEGCLSYVRTIDRLLKLL